MKLAHLADPHLGIRQYQRQAPGGVNQREADAARAFVEAVDGVIAARPDAVVVAGDLFHAVRPTNSAIVTAFREFQRLRAALPGAPVVLIAGNHDTPRSSETGSILGLFVEAGVDVADREMREFVYPALDLRIRAVPHSALAAPERPSLVASGGERFRVLVTHGEVEGIFPADRSSVEYGGVLLDGPGLARSGWSYVALGHYHIQCGAAPRVWYAGSLEYVSSNIWGELREERDAGIRGKGWLLADLESGEVECREVRLARRVLDLPPIAAAGLEAEALMAEIAGRVAAVPGGIEGQLVRLVVRDVSRAVAMKLDHPAIRAWKAAALHFQLDLRRPDPVRQTGAGARPAGRRSIAELVRGHLEERPLPPGIPRDRFVARGLELLAETEREYQED